MLNLIVYKCSCSALEFCVMLVLKNATPEHFEFRFNTLNRNVLVKPKPNLLPANAGRRF